jgi:pyruvate,orthophosphate dikinase
VAGRQRLNDNERLRTALPHVWALLNDVCRQLEAMAGDAQDFEFTVQSGVLFLLQTRRAKRTGWAALTIAVDMVEEGLLTPAKALALLHGIKLDAVVRTSFPETGTPPLATAEVASIGVASGAVALDPEAVKRASEASAPAILVRQETVTTDIEGMALAAGILTATGGRTSHAAVVARQLGKVCLVACPGLEIDLPHRQCRIGDALVNEGDFLSLDGNTGAVRLGRLEPLTERPERALAAIAAWRRAAAS